MILYNGNEVTPFENAILLNKNVKIFLQKLLSTLRSAKYNKMKEGWRFPDGSFPIRYQ